MGEMSCVPKEKKNLFVVRDIFTEGRRRESPKASSVQEMLVSEHFADFLGSTINIISRLHISPSHLKLA
jgi:hypothetical protein